MKTLKHFIALSLPVLLSGTICSSLVSLASADPESTQAASSAEWLKKASNEANEIKNDDVRSVVHLGIVEVAARMGDIDEALRKARMMPHPMLSAMDTIAKAQASLGDFASARKTLKKADGGNPMTWVALARIQAEKGDVPGAATAAKKLEEPHKSMALEAIVDAQAEAGDIDGALNTMKTFEQILQNDKAMSAVALARMREGETDLAMQLGRRIRDPERRSALFRKMADLSLEEERDENAFESILEAAVTATAEGASTATRDLDYVALLRVTSKTTDIGRSLEILRNIQTPSALAEAHALVAEAMAGVGMTDEAGAEIERALAVAFSISDDDAYGDICFALARDSIDDLNQALAVADRIANPFRRSLTLSGMGRLRVQSEDMDGAKRCYRAAKKASNQIQDPLERQGPTMLQVKLLLALGDMETGIAEAQPRADPSGCVYSCRLVGKYAAATYTEKECLTWLKGMTTPAASAGYCLGVAEGISEPKLHIQGGFADLLNAW